MKELDLTSLRYFVSACELASVSKAAEQESIVTSAMSKRLAQLEDDAGTALLMRRRDGVIPTPAGEMLLSRARVLLANARQISQDLADFGESVHGHVHVHAAMSAVAERLPDDIARFLSQEGHQSIQIHIEEGLSRDIIRKVRTDSNVVGIIWDSVNLEGLETLGYRNDHLAVVSHECHPLAELDSCLLADTLQFDRVGLQSTSATNATLAKAAQDSGRQASYKAMVSTFDACIKFVKANLGICVIPQEIAEPYAKAFGLKVVPLRDAWASRRFVVCFRDKSKLSRATSLLVDYLHAQGAGTSGSSINPADQ